MHADAAHAAELEEGVDEIVVARVEVESCLLDDEARLKGSSFACFTAVTFSISASSAIVCGSMLMTTRPGML